jgi:hypothetical protein
VTDVRPQTGHGPLIGEVNILEATIGQRGMGKSTYQCARVHEFVQQHRGQVYVIGHSLGARLPRKLPAELGGHDLPIEYHQNVNDLERALYARPTRWHILAPPLELDGRAQASTCDDLIAFSIRLSEGLRERAFQRAHPVKSIVRGKARDYTGLPCPAIAIIVDEGIAIESASSGKAGDKKSRKAKDWFLTWIYSLRHYHTALFYAIQNATARNWQLLSEATRVVVFRVRHQWALNAIQAAGGTRREMHAARRLPPHEFIALGEDAALADDDDAELDPINTGDDDEGDNDDGTTE